jgi:small subunit ribosomal protein S6
MRYYESLYIVNPNYEQDRLDEVMKTVVDKIGEYTFSIINHRVWGKKRLAYAIQKHKYGTFVLLHFETESAENLNSFERFMVLQNPILRNQTVVLDARPEVHIEEAPVVAEVAEADEKVEAPKAEVETTKEVVAEPAEEEPVIDLPPVEEESNEVEESAGEEASTDIVEEPAEEVEAVEEAVEEVVEPKETEEVQE